MCERLLAILSAAHTGIDDFSLQQPMVAAQIVRTSYHAILPATLDLARWVVPLLMVGWAIASGLGRAFVLRSLAPQSRWRPVSLMLLQLLRIVALALTVYVWFAMVRWAAARDIFRVAAGTEPNMVAFAAWLICLSLGSFIVWALWSWVLSIAGVLIVVEDRSLPSALAASRAAGAADHEARRGEPGAGHCQAGADRARHGLLGDSAALRSADERDALSTSGGPRSASGIWQYRISSRSPGWRRSSSSGSAAAGLRNNSG